MAAIGILLITHSSESRAEPPLTRAVHLLGNGGPLSLFVGFAAAGLGGADNPPSTSG